MTHEHTCTSCGVPIPCIPTRSATDGHAPDCPGTCCEDWIGCTGADGDGLCDVCVDLAFDQIGEAWPINNYGRRDG